MTLQKTETQQNIESLLPEFTSEDAEKREFLGYRICGFSVAESLKYSDLQGFTFSRWIEEDSIFNEIHSNELTKLQRDATDTILEQVRVKNYRLALAVDEETLDDAVTSGIDKLSDRQFEYLKTIRAKYDPKVTSLLGLQPGDRMPISLDEVTLRFRRANAEERSKEVDQHEIVAITTGEEPIIEAEYTESPSKPNRNKRRKTSKKTAS